MKLMPLVLLLILPLISFAKTVEYTDAGKKFEGVFLKSDKKKAPAVLLIHNWMGITEESLTQAKRFNDLGYNVFVADIYGKEVRPKSMDEAKSISGIYKEDRALYRKRLKKAFEVMKKQSGVDTSKLAAVGYCFGGTGVVELARSGAKLDGVVAFHGGIDSPNPKDGAKIKTKLLMLKGADDPFMPIKDDMAFQEEMRIHKVDYELVSYANTVHSFTEKAAGNDNSKGAAYNEQSDRRSFARAKDFLAEVL